MQKKFDNAISNGIIDNTIKHKVTDRKNLKFFEIHEKFTIKLWLNVVLVTTSYINLSTEKTAEYPTSNFCDGEFDSGSE